MGNDQGGLAHFIDNLGNGVGFARARGAQKHLGSQALCHACC